MSFAIYSSDARIFPDEYQDPEGLIQKAFNHFQSRKLFELFTTQQLGKNTVYQINCPVAALLHRRLLLNLTTINQVKQSNRNGIIKCIKALLKDVNPYNIVRLDVQKFYENCDRKAILNRLEGDPAYSNETCELVKLFFDSFEKAGLKGLPRGIGLSALLAEYHLRSFDRKIVQKLGTLYYARFVDDIIIVTTESTDETIDFVTRILPKGLKFNESPDKHKIIEVPSNRRFPKNIKTEDQFSFDYLGYGFRIKKTEEIREVIIDLASGKKNRFKKRIIKAFIDFSKTNNFRFLEARIKFLTSNYLIGDRRRSTKKRTGIYYNYQMVNTHLSFQELDNFITTICCNGRVQQNLLGKSIQMTANQRTKILRCSFVKGHSERIFYKVTRKSIGKIKRRWGY